MHVPSRRIFEWSEVSSANTAARWALEGCAQSYASPCVLIGVNDELRSPDPASARPWPMDRIAYRGRFDPARLPWNLDENPAVQNYPFLQGGRAIAVRPIGARVSVVGGAASIQDAEREALKRCNVVDDPYPCFVYASGDTVVLPLRRTEAAR